jgi:hypothetical protein
MMGLEAGKALIPIQGLSFYGFVTTRQAWALDGI